MEFRARGVGVLGVLLALSFAVPASGATWNVEEIPDGPTGGIAWAVSCPSTTLCVATGTNSMIATTTDPLSGPASWKTIHPEGYKGFAGGGSYPGNAIRGVSCPTTTFCAAAGPQGHFFASGSPTGGESSWSEYRLGLDATHMNGISCPTPSLCVAVGQNGRIVTTEEPLAAVEAWKITKLNEPFDLRGVSCPAPTLCVAVGLEGNILSSTNPGGGPEAWNVARQPAGEMMLNGVHCPSTSLCVTGNPGQMLTSTAPASGAWSAVSAGSGLAVSAVSCPTPSACVAVTDNSDVISSTDPTGGPAAWTFQTVIPHWLLPSGKENPNPKGGTNAMWGVSCPTTELCLAVGQERKLLVSTDPFAPTPLKKGPVNGGKGRKPHAVITYHPGKRVDDHRGGSRVTFRFRSIGKAAKFRCRINQRKLRDCASPMRYRLKRGHFHFKVFAIGPTGLKGPAARYRFRVGPILEQGPQATCPPGKEPAPGVRGCQVPPTG